MNSRFNLLQTLCVVLLILGAAQSQHTFAQNPSQTPMPAPTPQFLSLIVLSVKPEMMGEYQNFVKNTTNPALKKGGARYREVWQSTVVAGDAFEYVIVAPLDKFADFDGPSQLEKGLGSAQAFAAWQTKAGSLVNSVRRFVIRTRPDLSNPPTGPGNPKMAVIHSVHVSPDRTDDYENFLKTNLAPAMKQAKVTFLVARTIFGGDANEYITLTMRDSFADLDKGPVLVQALGEEEARKLQQKLPAGTVMHVERSLTRYVPELSITPTTP